MTTAFRVQPVLNKTHIMLDQWHVNSLSPALLEGLYKRFRKSIVHNADVVFFKNQETGTHHNGLLSRVSGDISGYVSIINNNLSTLKKLNESQKIIMEEFKQNTPRNRNEEAEATVDDFIINLGIFVKEKKADDFIGYFVGSDHSFLGFGKQPFTTTDESMRVIFKQDMALPIRIDRETCYYQVDLLGSPTYVVEVLNKLKALEESILKIYRQLTCGLSYRDTPYRNCVKDIIDNHMGMYYLTPFYDQVNTDIISLLAGMVIRLRIAILRFIHTMASNNS